MKKKTAILAAVLFVIAIVAMGYAALIGIGSSHAGSAANIKQGLDLAGGVSITYQVVGEETPDTADMEDTIYKLQKRVEGYSTEAQVYQEGLDRINIEIPGVTDANRILEELGRPGSLYFIYMTNEAGELNYQFVGVDENGKGVYALTKDIDTLMAEGSIPLDGTMVQAAQAGQTTSSQGVKESEYVVELMFTPEGSEAFAKATERAYNKGESIAIYYDGELISVPRVQAIITGGQAQITGMDGIEEAKTLASTIRIGGLKLELEEMRSNVVGAQLGSDALQGGIKAGIIGIILVCIFMMIVYLLPGVVASLALILYVIMILLVLNGFNITLTLPGIAGIILSVGMAVDANVIIFARIREEIGAGRGVETAVKAGFEKATSAIVDGNVTTLLAAIVLILMGSGSIKGFAQTLMIGIVLSMFTALVVSRLLINIFVSLGCTSEKLYGKTKERNTINFVSKKAIAFGISIAIILAGVAMLFVNKSSIGNSLNFSMEFMGGTSTTVTFNEDMTIEELDAQVVPLIEKITGDGAVQTQKVTGTNEVIIKTRTLTVAEREEMEETLLSNFSIPAENIQSETISATISNEMRRDAIIAVIIATILMLLYIWIRFKDLRFATSAVLALVHDVLVVLAFYAFSRTSVGNTFIACMLTIVGYSINATIVIFDRIRENLKTMKKADLSEVVNASITQTLTRSINTSLTTFITVFVLYILGVTSIREFAAPLMVGIICGAYSSVCITGPLWYVMRTKIVKKDKK